MTKTNNVTGYIYKVIKNTNNSSTFYIIAETGEKISVFSKGGKQGFSKKNILVEIGRKVDLELISGYKVLVLKSIKLVKENKDWVENLNNFYALSFICEITDKLCYEGQEEPDLYSLLNYVMTLQPSKIYFLCSFYIAVSLIVTGHLPDIFTDKNVLSETTVDIFWEDLTQENHYKKVIDITTYKVFKYLCTESEFSKIFKVKLSVTEERNLLAFAIEIFENTLNVKLKSKEFLL